MSARPSRKVRRLKFVLGMLIGCRTLLAMQAYTFGPTDWPIDARPCAGLLRATKLLFAGAAADVPEACVDCGIPVAPLFGDLP